MNFFYEEPSTLDIFLIVVKIMANAEIFELFFYVPETWIKTKNLAFYVKKVENLKKCKQK